MLKIQKNMNYKFLIIKQQIVHKQYLQFNSNRSSTDKIHTHNISEKNIIKFNTHQALTKVSEER